MSIHGSSRRGRGRLWLVVLAALGTALVSLLTLLHWDSPARAHEQRGRGQQIALAHSTASAIQHKEIGAANQKNVEPRIVGGTPVPDGKYPFMAALDIRFRDGSGASCDGTLIDPNSVLTAAHCLVQPQTSASGVRVEVGGTAKSQPQFQLRAATTATIHPSYAPSRTQSYDAAVLKLDSPVTGIKPINLATAKQNTLETPGRLLTVAGWGRTDPNDATSAVDRMREVSLPVVSDATTQQAIPYQAPFQYVPSLMVATDSQAGKDAAQGDSGGPLFNPGATPTQVGIVSFGNAGTTPGSPPTAYTEVNNPKIRTFILNAASS
jgi:secreted trypsin-like serine protease